MDWCFKGKTAVITGAGNGIGRATALAFSRFGANVAILDKNIAAANSTCEMNSNSQASMRAWQCDVSSENEVLATVAAVIKEFSQIDILFNNAGVNRRKPLNEWAEGDWNELIAVNFIGSFCMARAVGQHMVDHRSGAIINMSALGGGLIGLGRGTEIYTGTKGAIAAMSRDLAAEWAPFGVRVNCIAPGWIETEMNSPLLKHATAAQKVIDRVPLGRWGKPEDVVGAVLFLASDFAAYITGHLLPIDGGAASIIRLTNDEVIR